MFLNLPQRLVRIWDISSLTLASVLNSGNNNMTQREIENIKLGDKVRIKFDLVDEMEYNGFTFTRIMGRYKGNIITVKDKRIYEGMWYVTCNENEYNYPRDMLELLFKFGR